MRHHVLLRYLSVFIMAVVLSRLPSVEAFCHTPGRCKPPVNDNKPRTHQGQQAPPYVDRQYFSRRPEGSRGWGNHNCLYSTKTQTASTTSKRQNAKEVFLQNLERKRAGEDVPISVLNSDVSNLLRKSQTTEESRYSWTTVTDLPSWRGTWKICHAPHIDTLGGLLACSFPSVEYHFTADDGRMVSHSHYESPLFGSGWLSADGRVVAISTSQVAGAVAADAQNAPTIGVVKVRPSFPRICTTLRGTSEANKRLPSFCYVAECIPKWQYTRSFYTLQYARRNVSALIDAWVLSSSGLGNSFNNPSTGPPVGRITVQ